MWLELVKGVGTVPEILPVGVVTWHVYMTDNWTVCNKSVRTMDVPDSMPSSCTGICTTCAVRVDQYNASESTNLQKETEGVLRSLRRR